MDIRNGWHEDDYNNKIHYVNDLRHKEDGPAIICKNGSLFYFINNKFHREDGPACYYGKHYKEWWFKGKFVSNTKDFSLEQFKKHIKLLSFL